MIQSVRQLFATVFGRLSVSDHKKPSKDVTQPRDNTEQKRSSQQSAESVTGISVQSATSKLSDGKHQSNGWEFDQDAEFPWKLEQVVEETENYRTTWVLEVKDMMAMDWQTKRVANEIGRGFHYQLKATRQWPFSPDGNLEWGMLGGGQDDLMVQLGRGSL